MARSRRGHPDVHSGVFWRLAASRCDCCAWILWANQKGGASTTCTQPGRPSPRASSTTPERWQTASLGRRRRKMKNITKPCSFFCVDFYQVDATAPPSTKVTVRTSTWGLTQRPANVCLFFLLHPFCISAQMSQNCVACSLRMTSSQETRESSPSEKGKRWRWVSDMKQLLFLIYLGCKKKRKPNNMPRVLGLFSLPVHSCWTSRSCGGRWGTAEGRRGSYPTTSWGLLRRWTPLTQHR